MGCGSIDSLIFRIFSVRFGLLGVAGSTRAPTGPCWYCLRGARAILVSAAGCLGCGCAGGDGVSGWLGKDCFLAHNSGCCTCIMLRSIHGFKCYQPDLSLGSPLSTFHSMVSVSTDDFYLNTLLQKIYCLCPSFSTKVFQLVGYPEKQPMQGRWDKCLVLSLSLLGSLATSKDWPIKLSSFKYRYKLRDFKSVNCNFSLLH